MKARKLYDEIVSRKCAGQTSLQIARDLRVSYSLVTQYATLTDRLITPARQAFLGGDLSLSSALALSRLGHEDQAESLESLQRSRKRSVVEIRDYFYRLSTREDRGPRWQAVRDTLGWVLGMSGDEPW